MNKIDYQALREAAEKATCGVWSLEYGEERFDAGDALIHREVVGYLPICRIEGAHPESGFDEDFQMEQQANAEFIAAANPATVLALLGELETAKKRIAELEEREILLPERSSMLHRTDFHDDYQTVMAYKVSEVIDAIRATGIR
ncbi:ead/Ea22-like family protein, partial [Escherichia coli]